MKGKYEKCEYPNLECKGGCVGHTNMCLIHLFQSALDINGGGVGDKLKKNVKKRVEMVLNGKKVKRNKSAYIYFCMYKRDDVVKWCNIHNPGWDQKDVTRELGKMWQLIKIDAVKTSKYRELAKKDRVRYNKDVFEFERLSEVDTEQTDEAVVKPEMPEIVDLDDDIVETPPIQRGKRSGKKRDAEDSPNRY
jgi:hypothetical protein